VRGDLRGPHRAAEDSGMAGRDDRPPHPAVHDPGRRARRDRRDEGHRPDAGAGRRLEGTETTGTLTNGGTEETKTKRGGMARCAPRARGGPRLPAGARAACNVLARFFLRFSSVVPVSPFVSVSGPSVTSVDTDVSSYRQ